MVGLGGGREGDRWRTGPSRVGGRDIYHCGGGAPARRDPTRRRVPSRARMVALGSVHRAGHWACQATLIIPRETQRSVTGEQCTGPNRSAEPIPTGAPPFPSHPTGSGPRDGDRRMQGDETNGTIPRWPGSVGPGGPGGAMPSPGRGVAERIRGGPAGTGGALL
jgi:hypothetical protein